MWLVSIENNAVIISSIEVGCKEKKQVPRRANKGWLVVCLHKNMHVQLNDVCCHHMYKIVVDG